MRGKTIKCKYCGQQTTWKNIDRADQAYCRDKSSCRSKYHQEIGRGYRGNVTHHLIHEEKKHIHDHTCAECNEPFEVNDYAQRGGKRIPKFCSAKCKMRDYRRRKKQANKG